MIRVYIDDDDDFEFVGLMYNYDFMKFPDIDAFIEWIWKNLPKLRVKCCAKFKNGRTDFSGWGTRFQDVLKMFDDVSKYAKHPNHHLCYGNWSIRWETDTD